MGLIGWEALAPILACPRCRSELVTGTESYRCSASACRHSSEGFPLVGGLPVLIDFEDSILVKEEMTGPNKGVVIRRGGGAGLIGRIAKALLPANEVAGGKAEWLKALLKSQHEQPRLLIIGGASAGAGTETLYADEALDIVAFDIYSSKLVQFIGDAHQIPLADQSVDGTWIQAVLEHVLDPARVVSEIYRVLKPKGIVYAETPFMQQVHEGPYDFTRFTESGHRWLFRKFDVIDSGAVMGLGAQLTWSIEYVARGVFRSVRAGIIVKLLVFWLKYLDRIIPDSYAIDGASAVYFLGRKSHEPLSPRAMPAYYQGARARSREG